MPTPPPKRRAVPRWTLPALSGAVLVATWLFDVAGPGVPDAVARWVVLVAGVGLLASVTRAVAGLVARRRGAAWVLLAITAASLAVKLSTLDFELTSHARNDEGVYREIAEKINEGEVLPEVFNYGHLLYYAGALALWTGELFPETVRAGAGALYGVDSPFEVRRVLLRLITALLAALTAVPVFLAADRLAGPLAGAAGALLVTASTIHNEVAPQFTSDGPSAFFAALAFLYVVRLVEEESLADYLAAGTAAGLAAACKYPGGVVTVGIFGAWLVWRIRLRRFSWSLLWSAAACVGVMLLVMPALWLAPQGVFDPSASEGRDLLFGLRQYAFGGWLGVVPESVTMWNLRQLRADLGWPAILLGVFGWLALEPPRRRRLWVTLVFPVAYLLLLFSMSMAVRRNLLPALPAIGVVLGAGLAAWPRLLDAARPAWRRAAVAAVLVAALAHPLYAATAVTVRRNRPSTGEMATTWIRANIPEGAAFLREDYTPALRRESYPQVHRRFAARMSLEQIRDPAWDYLLLSQNAYIRFLDPGGWREPHHEAFAERYRQMFGFELVREFAPNRFRAGPLLQLYRLHPEEVRYRRERSFGPAEAAWVSDPKLRAAGAGRLRYTRRWQYALFKDYFEAGSYRAVAERRPAGGEGYLYVVSRENREVGSFPLDAEPEFKLSEPSKYFFRVFLAPRGELDRLTIERVD